VSVRFVERVMKAIAKKQYRDHAVPVTLKALSAAGVLDLNTSIAITTAITVTDDVIGADPSP
jgi:hypothetical protein